MVNVSHLPIFYYSVPVVAVLYMNTTHAGSHLSIQATNFDKDTNLKSYQQHNLNIPSLDFYPFFLESFQLTYSALRSLRHLYHTSSNRRFRRLSNPRRPKSPRDIYLQRVSTPVPII
jgi:hypothetical protein